MQAQKWRGATCACNGVIWGKITVYGLSSEKRQAELLRIAFPDSNRADVQAALDAGNKLERIYDLACGHASVARDAADRPKVGNKGLKIISPRRARIS